MGPHAAAMGVHFYTGSMFPAEYRNRLLVARKGSWNRSQKFGYDVVAVRTDANGSNPRVTPFLTGFLDASTDTFWRRPVYMLQMPEAGGHGALPGALPLKAPEPAATAAARALGGWVDATISRITDAFFLACPFLILAIALAAFPSRPISSVPEPVPRRQGPAGAGMGAEEAGIVEESTAAMSQPRVHREVGDVGQQLQQHGGMRSAADCLPRLSPPDHVIPPAASVAPREGRSWGKAGSAPTGQTSTPARAIMAPSPP